jgi:hypothetical protein
MAAHQAKASAVAATVGRLLPAGLRPGDWLQHDNGSAGSGGGAQERQTVAVMVTQYETGRHLSFRYDSHYQSDTMVPETNAQRRQQQPQGDGLRVQLRKGGSHLSEHFDLQNPQHVELLASLRLRAGPTFRVGERVEVHFPGSSGGRGTWHEAVVTAYTARGQPTPWRVEYRTRGVSATEQTAGAAAAVSAAGVPAGRVRGGDGGGGGGTTGAVLLDDDDAFQRLRRACFLVGAQSISSGAAICGRLS